MYTEIGEHLAREEGEARGDGGAEHDVGRDGGRGSVHPARKVSMSMMLECRRTGRREF